MKKCIPQFQKLSKIKNLLSNCFVAVFFFFFAATLTVPSGISYSTVLISKKPRNDAYRLHSYNSKTSFKKLLLRNLHKHSFIHKQHFEDNQNIYHCSQALLFLPTVQQSLIDGEVLPAAVEDVICTVHIVTLCS